jgi:hypothetical protein
MTIALWMRIRMQWEWRSAEGSRIGRAWRAAERQQAETTSRFMIAPYLQRMPISEWLWQWIGHLRQGGKIKQTLVSWLKNNKRVRHDDVPNATTISWRLARTRRYFNSFYEDKDVAATNKSGNKRKRVLMIHIKCVFHIWLHIRRLTLGLRSLTTLLAWPARLIIASEYCSATSCVIVGNLLNTWPCLLHITYPSTPCWTLILSIVSSTSLYKLKMTNKHD